MSTNVLESLNLEFKRKVEELCAFPSKPIIDDSCSSYNDGYQLGMLTDRKYINMEVDYGF